MRKAGFTVRAASRAQPSGYPGEMRIESTALLPLVLGVAACVSTTTLPAPAPSRARLEVAREAAADGADPRWLEAHETLEALSRRCETRRAALTEEASEAQRAGTIASVVAVAAAIAGEVADGSGTTPEVAIGDARCPAPAGPTTTLPGHEQAGAMPCGGMAAAGGGGPIAQRAVSAQLTAAEQVEAMERQLAQADEWLDLRRTWPNWEEEDVTEWQAQESALRSLCDP